MITGCAGFIGSHLTEKLLKDNHTVYGTDNFDPFYSVNLKQNNIKHLKNLNGEFHFISADVKDNEIMRLIFIQNEIDKVIHIAARAGVRTSTKLPHSYVDNNILSTVILLELCREFDVNHFILGSSSSVYVDSTELPYREDAKADRPLNPYAASKRSAEIFCHSYAHLYSINTIMLRFFTVYGPRQRLEMAIAKFTKNNNDGKEITVFGDSESERDYTYIDDIVNGICLSLNKKFGYEIFNLGYGNPVKLKNVITAIENELSKKTVIKYIPKIKADVENTLADISKATEKLGYIPKVTINVEIRKYIEWFRKNNFSTSRT